MKTQIGHDRQRRQCHGTSPGFAAAIALCGLTYWWLQREYA
jgi:hypothetical protein